jgi:hypothetical protein
VSPPALSEATAELAAGWRDAAEAALRFWGRLGRLAYESVAAVVPVVEEVRPVAPAAPAPLVPRTILVEAEAGEAGLGVFLLENTTERQLSTPVSVSGFHDDHGREVQPRVAFRPEPIMLDPGDQLAVQVAVAVDETLTPGVRYHAEIGVPGLSDARIPIVVRRRESSARRSTRQQKAKTRAA